MKIQLIHPPVLLNLDALTALRPSLPLGLAYIAAVLEKAGHEVGVIDAVSEAPDQVVKAGRLFRMGLSAEQISARVEPDTQAIGISNMWSFSWSIVREMIHVLRRDHPRLKIVCGGEHFSGLPEHSMQEAPIDFCAIGEGEETAVELFAAIAEGREDYSDIPGIVWRRKVSAAVGAGARSGGGVGLLEAPGGEDASAGEVVRNPRRDRTRAVDNIPWPAWHLFDVLKYDEKKLIFGIHYGRTIPILATRGCPY
ncbi:MAG: cobalamin-dependent protein [Planctomycetes bacterium]|nr:cobalamin-dependent protein [Planctomycetota bacterium]